MRYGINDIPTPGAFLLYGLQWWVVTLPCVVIIGVVTARLHFTDAAAQLWHMQKLFALIGLATVAQVLAGHRLPLVIGPASALLVGIIASLASGPDAVYTAIFLGGAALAVAGGANLLTPLRRFFTTRIVVVILMLIALTLSPMILRLIIGEGGMFAACFSLGLVFALTCINNALKGAAKSLTVLVGMVGGAAFYGAVRGFPALALSQGGGGETLSWFVSWRFEPGTVLAFAFCFLALTINELGSIEALGQMLKVDGMEQRIRRGVGFTGLANMAAGGLGVIGPVDFSMSSGIIAATGCASRYTLIPAGLGIAACALFPSFIMVIGSIPGPVMGALLLYLMATQLASGLLLMHADGSVTDFSGGIIVGLPLMIGLLVAFAPADFFAAFPALIRPVIGNGFVMGTLSVIVLEHGIFRGAHAK